MNFKQLAKNVGQTLRLRPHPRRSKAGRRSPVVQDDLWRLDRVLTNPNGVILANTVTQHVLELLSDNLRNYQTPNFLLLRCQVLLSDSGADIEPLLPSTRQLLPIARYQAGGPAATDSYVPVVPEVCDGCTASVQFRPLTTITLMNDDGSSEDPESFCPPCARKRGLHVSAPEGMSAPTLFADTNPPLWAHASRLLKAWGLRWLGEDPEVRTAGATAVGASLSSEWATLLVSRPGPPLEVPIPIHTLREAAEESDLDLLEDVRQRLLAALRVS